MCAYVTEDFSAISAVMAGVGKAKLRAALFALRALGVRDEGGRHVGRVKVAMKCIHRC